MGKLLPFLSQKGVYARAARAICSQLNLPPQHQCAITHAAPTVTGGSVQWQSSTVVMHPKDEQDYARTPADAKANRYPMGIGVAECVAHCLLCNAVGRNPNGIVKFGKQRWVTLNVELEAETGGFHSMTHCAVTKRADESKFAQCSWMQSFQNLTQGASHASAYLPQLIDEGALRRRDEIRFSELDVGLQRREVLTYFVVQVCRQAPTFFLLSTNDTSGRFRQRFAGMLLTCSRGLQLLASVAKLIDRDTEHQCHRPSECDEHLQPDRRLWRGAKVVFYGKCNAHHEHRDCGAAPAMTDGKHDDPSQQK